MTFIIYQFVVLFFFYIIDLITFFQVEGREEDGMIDFVCKHLNHNKDR